MPELKRIFSAGKMNRDLDDRLVPPGEYREALNVNIGRAEGSDVGAVENLLGNEVLELIGISGGVCIGSLRDNGNERIYFFVTSNNSADFSNTGEHGIYEFSQTSRRVRTVLVNNELNFHQSFPITGVNLVDTLLFWTDDRNNPRKINVDRARNDSNYYNTTNIDDLLSVAKFAPYQSPTITNVSDRDLNTDGNTVVIDSNFLRDKLPRFSYRYKFDDGEYSVLAPFSPIVFSRLNNTDTTVVAGEIPSFVNDVKVVNIQVPVPQGFGITDVELIYKETTSSTLYIVDESPTIEGDSLIFTYRSQDPFRALPGSQLTRVSDAVPRLAKSQELAGSRVVYGNYLHNYDIPEIDFTVTVSTDDDVRHDVLTNFSVKSRRTYQVGIVLSDRYGRISPVILSRSGGDTVYVNPVTGNAQDAFQGLRVSFTDTSQFPSWAYSYRIVVKQREQEYYNWLGAPTRVGTDAVNKIPLDQTVVGEGNLEGRPSSTTVYPKVLSGGANDTSDQLLSVFINQNGGADVPIINDSGDRVNRTDVIVYETDPFISNLDIFFETSTGGLVSGLVDANVAVDVEFYNCYLVSVGNYHVEANRLRLGFNEPAFDVGVRAHIVQENFAEERRSNALIHSSGLFNSRTGLNQLNQFNEAEGGITISLDPQDGSIQKLFAEDTQMIIWQEDKVSRSPIDKDFIFSAEGGAVPVTSNTQYLGTIAPYEGEYGISRDPQSFAVYGNRKYFTDKNRGVVLRLSNNGLEEISRYGMSDFFRDSLRTSNQVIGSFDEYHDTYNLTIIGEGYSGNTDTNVGTASQGFLTTSFEEDVNGWSSFKSFRQENGQTLNNTYYTFSGGNIWEHNSENVLRNSFYGQPSAESYIECIFNDQPSLVKEFKTIGYEGTNGWDCEYVITDSENIGDAPLTDNTVRTTLQVMSQAPNTLVSGERTITSREGSGISWTIRFTPSSTLYEFREVGDISLSTSFDSLTITPPATIVDGDLYFTITTTAQSTDQIYTINIDESSTGPELTADVSFLTITVRDNIANAFVDPAVTRFTTPDSREAADFTITPEEGHYIVSQRVDIGLEGVSDFNPSFPMATDTLGESRGFRYLLDVPPAGSPGSGVISFSSFPAGPAVLPFPRVTYNYNIPSTTIAAPRIIIRGDDTLAQPVTVAAPVDTDMFTYRDFLSPNAQVLSEAVTFRVPTALESSHVAVERDDAPHITSSGIAPLFAGDTLHPIADTDQLLWTFEGNIVRVSIAGVFSDSASTVNVLIDPIQVAQLGQGAEFASISFGADPTGTNVTRTFTNNTSFIMTVDPTNIADLAGSTWGPTGGTQQPINQPLRVDPNIIGDTSSVDFMFGPTIVGTHEITASPVLTRLTALSDETININIT